MNINHLRKNYNVLSFRERYSIYRNASSRNDESELNSIILASPKLDYKQVDFAHFDEIVLMLNLGNVLQRLDFSARFDLFLNHKHKEDERIIERLFLTGYLYTIETDSWKAVGDEFGFDVEDFRNKMAESCLAIRVMDLSDKLIRDFSYSEEGIKRYCEEKQLPLSEMKTLETETEKYRELLIEAENQAT